MSNRLGLEKLVQLKQKIEISGVNTYSYYCWGTKQFDRVIWSFDLNVFEIMRVDSSYYCWGSKQSVRLIRNFDLNVFEIMRVDCIYVVASLLYTFSEQSSFIQETTVSQCLYTTDKAGYIQISWGLKLYFLQECAFKKNIYFLFWALFWYEKFVHLQQFLIVCESTVGWYILQNRRISLKCFIEKLDSHVCWTLI